MRKLWVMLFILSAFPGIACSEQAGNPTAQEQQPPSQPGYSTPAPAQQEAALQEAEGALSKVDSQMKLIWIKTSDGKEMQFDYNMDTHVEGAETVEGLAKMSGNNVRVRFRAEDKGNVAVHIEVLPRSA